MPTDQLTNEPSTLHERALIGCELIADGRTLRRDRNRERVLEALIALADSGDPEPSIEAVAGRAEVSNRSVYRYFDDRTNLTLCAIGHLIGDMWRIFEIADLGEGPLEHRIDRFTASRLAAYHRLAPLTRLAIRHGADDAVVLEHYDRVRGHLRRQLEAQFAPELDRLSAEERACTVGALNIAFQFEALESWVQFEGLDDDTVAAILRCQLAAHLAATSSVVGV